MKKKTLRSAEAQLGESDQGLKENRLGEAEEEESREC